MRAILEQIVADKGLEIVSDEGALEKAVDEALAANWMLWKV